jgi:ABC-type phosphate transport system auxiliary subunit
MFEHIFHQKTPADTNQDKKKSANFFGRIFHRKTSAKPKEESEQTAEQKFEPKVEPKGESGPSVEHKKKIAMVPFFSWRTFLVIVIGLVLGLLISLGYWLMSPSITATTGSASSTASGGSNGGAESSGLLGILGMAPNGPYESNIRIQVVSPSSEYNPLRTLQQMGEYFAAKANSRPFYEFLETKLSHQTPEFTYDVDTLDHMIDAEYDYNSELPLIKMTVTANTSREAIGLAALLPDDFREYLKSEEDDEQKTQYDDTVKAIDDAKTALYTAQQELDALNPTETVTSDPAYIALKAKVDSLQTLVDTQAAEITNQEIGNTDTQAEYDATVVQIKTISAKLNTAKQDLQHLEEAQNGTTDDSSSIVLNAKITALQDELDKQMTGYTETQGNTQTHVTGLAEMIANGDTTSADYIYRQKKVETISNALAEAKKELASVTSQETPDLSTNADYQIASIKVETLTAELTTLQDNLGKLYQQILDEERADQTDLQTAFSKSSEALASAKTEFSDLEKQLGYDHLAADLNYKIAQDKVDNLDTRLTDLTKQLGDLVGNTSYSSDADYLIAGNPTIPSPVLPERGRARNTLIMGAVIGAIVGWGILNFRWIAKGMPSSSTPPSQDEK